MKALELLRSISKNIGSADLDGALSASDIREVDIPDEEAQKIQKKFSTLISADDAVNNPSVYKAFVEKEINSTDSQLHSRIKKDVMEKKERAWRDKYGDILGEAERLDDMADILFSQGKDKNVKQISEAYEKAKKEAADMASAFENFKKESEANQRAMREDFALDSYLNSKYQLADAYQDDMVKSGILNGIKATVKKQARIALGDNNQIELRDKENPEMKFYIENKAAGLGDLVGPMIGKYVKKNDKPTSSTPNLPDTPVPSQPMSAMERERQAKIKKSGANVVSSF
jgi:hypothetical protein